MRGLPRSDRFAGIPATRGKIQITIAKNHKPIEALEFEYLDLGIGLIGISL
jgi:hypothetical protein